MHHDEGWLKGTRKTMKSVLLEDGVTVFTLDQALLLSEKIAKEYAEHTMKWMPIRDTPVAGMWVEVLCNELGDIHTITYGPARFKDTDIGWRPAMQLPTDIKE